MGLHAGDAGKRTSGIPINLLLAPGSVARQNGWCRSAGPFRPVVRQDSYKKCCMEPGADEENIRQ